MAREMTGAALGWRMVRVDKLVAVPLGVVMEMGLLAARVGTTAVTLVSLLTVKEAAEMLPKRTAVVPASFVPVIVTKSPGAAEEGVNELIEGGGGGGAVTMKFVERLMIPAAERVESRVALPVQLPKILVPMGAPEKVKLFKVRLRKSAPATAANRLKPTP